MLSRIIEVCARNRFLVFTGVLLLTLAGIWSLQHVPLDALPDISDVQVIVHTGWAGEPPDVIEDQVTYPIVTSLLAAPHVKAVRAQTMFGDSYVYVVFQDGTDLYWARSRVIEYLQQISGRLPENVHPSIGPDATGAGWVYEYAIVDKSGKHSLADLRSLQDWHLRYALETVPGVAEVASIGGFVKQYQVQLDPNKLLAYGIPLSTVIDKVKMSTNEVGGRVLNLSGADYMIRGLGYLRSLDDLATVAVGSKNGTPILVRDLGTVSFGPDIREGVAEWHGDGETVGGIIVMRQGMNALNVINGVKQKLREIAPSLPPGVQIMTGYDRSDLIDASIKTLQRDLLEEAVIVSLVIIVFLFHFRSALIAILALPIAVLMSFIPMYWLGVSSNIMSLGGIALAIGVLVDASIVMVENGYRHLSERQENDASPVSEPERQTDSYQRGQAGWSGALLFTADHCRFLYAGLPARSARRTHVPPAGMDQDPGSRLFLHPCHHPCAGPDGDADSRPSAAGTCQSNLAHHAGDLPATPAILPAPPLAHHCGQPDLSGGHVSTCIAFGQSVHAGSL